MLLAGSEINSNWFKTYYGNCDINGSQNVSSVLDEIKENDYMYLCYENDAFSSDDIEILKKLGENVCSTDFATVIELK